MKKIEEVSKKGTVDASFSECNPFSDEDWVALELVCKLNTGIN